MGMSLVEGVHKLTSEFPEGERFGLMAQMRRAAASVPTNIAEGAARRSTLEYLRFLSIARGSLSELDTHMQIAERLGFARDTKELTECIDLLFAKLNGLVRSLQRSTRAKASRSHP
ncbi:MAG TPA: four helix bundle protein [Rudaea sp.]|nr:four helix bundle protein [Rudaea sp.]